MKPDKRTAGFVLLTIKEFQLRRDSRPVSLTRLKAKIRGQIRVKELNVILDYLNRRGETFIPKKGFVKWI